MKKFLVLLLMLFFTNVAFAVNSYDRYGQKTGSYRQLILMTVMGKRPVLTGKQLQATIHMIDMVLKQARIRKHHLAIINMTSTVKKLEAIKRLPQDIIPTINMDRKLVVTRQILMA